MRASAQPPHVRLPAELPNRRDRLCIGRPQRRQKVASPALNEVQTPASPNPTMSALTAKQILICGE